MQREVTLLSVIMGALIVGLLVFGRADYLRAYDTAAGQLFLGVDPRDLCRAARAGATPGPLPAPEPVPHRVRSRPMRRPIGGGPVSPIGAIVLCSFVLVGGVWLAMSGWRQPRPRLDDAMAHLRRRPVGASGHADDVAERATVHRRPRR